MESEAIVKCIFAALLKHKKVDAYLVHQEYSLYPGDIYLGLEWMKVNGWISQDGEIEITAAGRKELIMNKSKYFFQTPASWKVIPEKMLENRKKDSYNITVGKNQLKSKGVKY